MVVWCVGGVGGWVIGGVGVVGGAGGVGGVVGGWCVGGVLIGGIAPCGLVWLVLVCWCPCMCVLHWG